MSEENPIGNERMPILEIDSLTVERSLGFGERGVSLRGISLSIFEKEIAVFAGEAGSGKSILSRLILGAVEPQTKILAGAIRFDGVDLLSLRSRKRRELRRRELGFIGRTAEDVFNLEHTVHQSLREFCRLGGRHDRMIEEKDWSDIFYSVGIVEPERVLSQPIGSLSLLMVQKVALMRSLISGARLLICDNSTSGLDRIAEGQFHELLYQLREERGLTIVMVMGNARGIGRLADRVSVFYEGGVLESGEAAEILSRPRFMYSTEFFASAPSLNDHPRELPGISREAIQEAEEFIHGSAHSVAPADGVGE
ncbi:MAG: ATP-binding cassette domain-containing protein [Verrucomicrobiales bacterium]|nr:ATP-binding cassette domain-containing protein [Verrucomicrobiales bacterium]